MLIQIGFLVALFVCINGVSYNEETSREAEIAFHWNLVEYEWPNATMKKQEIDAGRYVPENNAINGIKLYKGRVYVTVPRLKAGIPSTLNVIVENTSPDVTSVSHVLRPFPSWAMQKLGDCNSLQGVQSMEIDPKTGYMWIVDTGARGDQGDVVTIDVCTPKIIIYDINNDKEVHRYIFPARTIGLGVIYLNDIVLDYVDGVVRYAYISDTLDYKLVVYDYLLNDSYYYSHPNMAADKQYENITISDITFNGIVTGINGLAMSPDFKYLYYSSVAGVRLYQIETSVLRTSGGQSGAFAAAVRTVGEKVSTGDGMVYGSKNNLYYSSLSSNAVYKWDISKDIGPDGDISKVQLTSQSKLVSDSRMEWVDTLAMDENGYLWFTTSRLHKFFSTGGIVNESNFFVWKVFVDEYSYLDTIDRGHETLGAESIFLSLQVMLCSLICFLLPSV